MIKECHEGVSFFAGLGGHFLVDLFIMPLLVALGWKAHKHSHNHADDQTEGT